MAGVGVLINPGSGRGNGKGLALAQKLSDTAKIKVIVMKDFSALPEHMREFIAAGIRSLFISSGDGTVQAIQTILAETYAEDERPRLCLLPHGTTNMTAADLGFRRKSIAAQSAFINEPLFTRLKERPTLRVANPRDERVRHGMFLGAGVVAEASLYCQKVFNDQGIKGGLAPFGVLTKALIKTAFSKPDPYDLNRFDRPFPLELHADHMTMCDGEQLLALCTTLEKLILSARPFWGGSAGSIRCSVFPYPIPNVWRWIFPTLYGTEMRQMPKGAKSVSCETVSIRCPARYVIDGEFFDGPDHEPLEIETGPVFTYIVA